MTQCQYDIITIPTASSSAGILLRRFLGDPGLEGVSHVVIDEVHERSLDTDLSLLLLRDLLNQGSPIKVILMSATANAELFASYFSNQVTICHLSKALRSCARHADEQLCLHKHVPETAELDMLASRNYHAHSCLAACEMPSLVIQPLLNCPTAAQTLCC